MNIKSDYGVYYSTKDSEEYYFVWQSMKIYFSSMYNLTRFKEKLSSYIYEENQKINNKYKINIDLTDYLILALYRLIEKRGYKILEIGTGKEIIKSDEFNLKLKSFIVGD